MAFRERPSIHEGTRSPGGGGRRAGPVPLVSWLDPVRRSIFHLFLFISSNVRILRFDWFNPSISSPPGDEIKADGIKATCLGRDI